MAEFDVVVIGGGPAGSTAGRILSEWGYSVLLLNRPAGRQPGLAESIPPSCRKLFSFLGILDRVDAAGFYRSRGNTVWWGDSKGRVETFAADSDTWGYQVPRLDLDRLLLTLAEGSGARICRDAAVRDVCLERNEEACIEYRTSTQERASVKARFVLDCSGRAGVIARRGFRKSEPGCTTLAIAGIWRRNNGWQLEDETHTLVETHRDGWAWSVPLSTDARYFTVMADYRNRAGARPRGLESIYRTELEKTTHFKRFLSGSALQSPIWSCDASLYFARKYAGPNFLLVGDAASFIDPLSSFGVKKALISAWIGAVATNTCLNSPGMRRAALDFFSDREARIYASYLRRSALYYREAAARHPHRFWTERARLPVQAQACQFDEEELRLDPEVIAAFQALRESPSIRLQCAANVRIEKRTGIREREIVLEEAVVSPGLPQGARFLGNVNLPKLLGIAGASRQVPDLFEAYNRICPPVELPDFLGALSALLAKKILINEAH